MNSDITSVRGNSVPQGGAAATMDMGQACPILPDTLTMMRYAENFMNTSEQNRTKLNVSALVPGQQTSFVVNNVGFGETLELSCSGTFSLNNTLTAAQQVNLGFGFPFTLVSNIVAQFNGATVLHNLSGYELLAVMAKRNKNVFINSIPSAATAGYFTQNTVRVDNQLAYMTATNATLHAGNGLLGCDYITVSASSTAVVSFGFYLELPFTLRRDIPLGLLPMQNNSVYLNIQLSTPSILGTTDASPMYVAGAVPATLTNSANAMTVQPTYNFWSVPLPNDPRVYQFLTSHNYMLQSQGGNTLSATGAEAFKYNLPNNYYLLAMLLTLRDSTGALSDIPSMLDNPYLSYNGTARVDRSDMHTRFARQRIYAESPVTAAGQLLWDYSDVSYLPNGVNLSKALDMYLSNNPQWVADVGSTFSTNGTFSVLREQLVPANVNII